MKDDVRDTRLADAMDDAVLGVHAGSRVPLSEIHRRGSRRRVTRWAASAVALAVFVGAVGIGAAEWASRGSNPAGDNGWSSFGSREAGWIIRYPKSWRFQAIDDRACASTNARVGAFISNVPFDLHHPDGSRKGACNHGRWVFAAFPPNGVALEIEPVGVVVGPHPQPDTKFPLHPEDLHSSGGIRGGPDHSFLSVGRDGGWMMNVRLYTGHRSTPQDQHLAARTLASLRLTVPAQTFPSHRVPRLGICPTARGVAANFSPVGEAVAFLGDIDGDGRDDQAAVVDVPGFPDSCSRFVVVQTAGERMAARVPEWWAPQMPKVAALANIDTAQGSDVVVTFDAGGVSRQVAIFSIRDGDLMALRLPEIFIVADARREAANLDCAGAPGSGQVVWTTTGPRRGPTTLVLRLFYRLIGTRFQLAPRRTQRLRVPTPSVGTPRIASLVPEMANLKLMFPSCPAS
jgi:hypothetical protein